MNRFMAFLNNDAPSGGSITFRTQHLGINKCKGIKLHDEYFWTSDITADGE